MSKKNSLQQNPSPGPKKPGKKPMGINERLGLISLIDEGMRQGSSESPIVADLFSNLWDLVHETASGSKINRLKPEETRNGFSVFEINAETGENLGRLNMMYLKKPIRCYYLVYVEVASPFRKKGLGNRILEYFRDFLIKKSAVGILDNIIPEEDPTYAIYFKQAWEPVEAVIGDGVSNRDGNYMIFTPPKLQGKDLREPLLKLLYHLKRKRAAIEMRDNEMMVQRTIAEFKDLYEALLTYFDREIQKGDSSTLMRFMFTRFATKFIAFRRSIGDLIGYTGGDSLQQIFISPGIAACPVQSYAPSELENPSSFVTGDTGLWLRIPKELKKHPARVIESLPNYHRPSLLGWLEDHGQSPTGPLTIGDLLDLGFDPTRLKEITIDGDEFIFERIQAKQIPALEIKKALLERLSKKVSGLRVRNAQLKTNPPLLVIRDRGNAYVLRRKVNGIHWEEAVEQLESSPALQSMNASIKIDRLILATIRESNRILEELLGEGEESLLDRMTFFVSWDLKNNRPGLMIDFANTFLETVWVT